MIFRNYALEKAKLVSFAGLRPVSLAMNPYLVIASEVSNLTVIV